MEELYGCLQNPEAAPTNYTPPLGKFGVGRAARKVPNLDSAPCVCVCVEGTFVGG